MAKAEGNQPNFDFDLKKGEVGENIVNLFFQDSLDEGITIEVKTDYRANETGNWYVETHKYRDDKPEEAVPSGINVTTAKWWIQASPSGDAFVVMKTSALKKYIELVDPPKGSQGISNQKSAASLGLKVKISGLMRYLQLGSLGFGK